jgi:photosystem I reaction center PsaK
MAPRVPFAGLGGAAAHTRRAVERASTSAFRHPALLAPARPLAARARPAADAVPRRRAPRQIMVASTGLILAAGRFGLAPSANRTASAGLKLTESKQGQLSGDPAGFTASDVLYGGSVGHSACPRACLPCAPRLTHAPRNSHRRGHRAGPARRWRAVNAHPGLAAKMRVQCEEMRSPAFRLCWPPRRRHSIAHASKAGKVRGHEAS